MTSADEAASQTVQPANRNPEVERWLDERQHPLDGAVRRVRDVILDADERVSESIKWSTPTFSYKGNIASFNSSKRVVSLLFHRGAEIPGEHPRLCGDGQLVRSMRFAGLEEVDAGASELQAVIRAWCDLRDGA